MSSLSERVRTLEADLKASPMRHYIYNDLPFAIFCYPPRQEWTMRREIALLRTRFRRVTVKPLNLLAMTGTTALLPAPGI